MGVFHRPTSLPEALETLASGSYTVLAGGTDFYPSRVGRPLDDDVLDISAIPALKGVSEQEDCWRIGALTSWSALLEAALPAWCDGLKLAAREVGGRQIQNAGTIGGNICNASPAADGVPVLASLDAEVEMAGRGGVRRLPILEFVEGPRRTALRPGELVTALRLPKLSDGARGDFLKLGARRYLVISITMLAGVLAFDAAGRVCHARFAVGACGPVARRLPALEAALYGKARGSDLAACVAPAHLAPLAPIDDFRGSGAYRRDATLTLLRRMLSRLAGAS